MDSLRVSDLEDNKAVKTFPLFAERGKRHGR